MISYVNVHAVLEGRRNRAKASPSDVDLSQVLLHCVFYTPRKDSAFLTWGQPLFVIKESVPS